MESVQFEFNDIITPIRVYEKQFWKETVYQPKLLYIVTISTVDGKLN